MQTVFRARVDRPQLVADMLEELNDVENIHVEVTRYELRLHGTVAKQDMHISFAYKWTLNERAFNAECLPERHFNCRLGGSHSGEIKRSNFAACISKSTSGLIIQGVEPKCVGEDGRHTHAHPHTYLSSLVVDEIQTAALPAATHFIPVLTSHSRHVSACNDSDDDDDDDSPPRFGITMDAVHQQKFATCNQSCVSFVPAVIVSLDAPTTIKQNMRREEEEEDEDGEDAPPHRYLVSHLRRALA
jgi:hypothetical protein